MIYDDEFVLGLPAGVFYALDRVLNPYFDQVDSRDQVAFADNARETRALVLEVARASKNRPLEIATELDTLASSDTADQIHDSLRDISGTVAAVVRQKRELAASERF